MFSFGLEEKENKVFSLASLQDVADLPARTRDIMYSNGQTLFD